MTDKHTDDDRPEPGSTEDLLPDTDPKADAAKAIEKKGEPEGGGNFA